MFTAAEQRRGHRQRGLPLQRLDRQASGDAAVQRHLDHVVGGLRRGAGGRSHDRLDRRTALRAGTLRHLEDFERARAIGQAAQELALLKRADQAVNPRFGLEIERFLHLLERRRNPRFGEAIVDEADQLMLLGGKHSQSSKGTDTERL